MDNKARKEKRKLGLGRLFYNREKGGGDSRLDLTFLDQDGLILLPHVGGDLDVRGPVGFADDFRFLRRGLAYFDWKSKRSIFDDRGNWG